MPSIVAFVTDLHINSTVALCPPQFHLDGGGVYYANPTQRWIWKCWKDFWGKVKTVKEHLGADVYSVFNGDLVDLNSHSGYESITRNEHDIIDNALTALLPALKVTDHSFVVRGTEAHSGGVGWFEEQIAKQIGAERDSFTKTNSWYWLPMKLNDVFLGFAHHPGTNSTRPWTSGNAANRKAMMLMDSYFGDGEFPQLVTYGHFHHDEDSFDNHAIRVIYTVPWIATTSFDSRCGRSEQRPKIGGNIYVLNDGKYKIRKIRYQPKRREPWIQKKR